MNQSLRWVNGNFGGLVLYANSVKQDDFNRQLEAAGPKLVVVDFYATWCGPCKNIAPKIEKMSQEFKDNVVFLKVNVDKNEVSIKPFWVQFIDSVGTGNKYRVQDQINADIRFHKEQAKGRWMRRS